MDQLIVLVVVGVVALAKWLLENAGRFQQGEGSDLPERRTQQPPGTAPEASEEERERMRRFMEALGLPELGAPPASARNLKPPSKPPVRPAADSRRPRQPAVRPLARPGREPLAPVRPSIAPPLETGGPLPELPKTASVSESAPCMEVAPIPALEWAQPVSTAPAPAGGPRRPTPAPVASESKRPGAAGDRSALREQLRTPAALRRAILVREILGPPKGLQSAQSTSIFSPL